MNKQKRQLVLSATCAALAAMSVFAYTATIKSEAQTQRMQAIEHYGGLQVNVVVAARDIGIGEEIAAGDVSEVEWLVDLLPQSDVATQLSEVEGQVAQSDIKKNEPILLERVGTSSSRVAVPNGLEAVSISSDDVLAVGGAIRAGSLVDVYVETSKGKIVQLGERILVLETSTLGSSDDAAKQITWVTLAVDPSNVSDLIAASTKGTIHLALPSSASSGKGQR